MPSVNEAGRKEPKQLQYSKLQEESKFFLLKQVAINKSYRLFTSDGSTRQTTT